MMVSKAQSNPDEQQWRLLMDRVQNGDRNAYRQMLESFQNWLISYYRISKKLAQEIIKAVHSKLRSCGANQPVSDWLEAIAQYKISRNEEKQRYAYQQLSPIPT